MLTDESRNYFTQFDRWSSQDLDNFFLLVDQIKLNPESRPLNGATTALLFFEPSTRTRMSYETAAIREGLYPLLIDGAQGTSLEKGETLEDTIFNVAAMGPSCFVVRGPDALNFRALSERLNVPLLCAGWGKKAHPSQALLDVYTLREKFGNLRGVRLLIVGDIIHSRVISSLLEIAPGFGLEVGFVAPPSLLPNVTSYPIFKNLSEGLEWAQAAIFLRVQFERHQLELDRATYRQSYTWQRYHDSFLQRGGVLMHPGPVNYDMELPEEVARHPQSLILNQVENGVFIRRALLRLALGRVS